MTTRVEDVMTRNVVSLRRHAQYKEIVQVMRSRKFSAFPVLDDHDRVIGMVSEDDLLVKEAYSDSGSRAGVLPRHGDKAKAAGLCAAELMHRPAITIEPDATVAEAARLMHARHVKRLPVVDGPSRRLVGIVSRVDLLGVYDRPDEDIRKEILEEVIEAEFVLDRLAFGVTVAGGVVTVSGPVHSQPVALSLLAAIRRVDGVVAVRDRLSYPRR
ncbi:MAG TPA: CBS domain-containing protein [Streptosporangiaceae bacterium]|jgi:CBS domain-containing protein|nr:CBS domain-containing protein [Streptosporangiaceae bacterium]